MERTRALAFAALASLAVSAGCAGSGPSAPVPNPGSNTYAKFSITVPVSSSGSSARRPNFDAPSGTQSLSITLKSVNGVAQSGQPTVANVTAGSPGCTTGSSQVTCSVTVPAVDGTDVYWVTSYSQPNGKGTAIATGLASVSAVAGQTVSAPLTLSGTVASIALSLGALPVSGYAASIPLVVVAKDSSGATIMGTYTNAITLSDSDTTGATLLASGTAKGATSATVADSTTASNVAIAYNGSSLTAAAQISAASSGVSASQITNVSFAPNNDHAVPSGTLTYNASATEVFVPVSGTPSPQQTASATLTINYTTGATFNNQSNLVDVNTKTTFNSSGGVGIGFGFFPYAMLSPFSSGDTYYSASSSAASASLYEIGWADPYTDQYNNSVNDQLVMGGAGQLVAELPFKSGNTWNAAASSVETYTADSYGSGGVVVGNDKDVYTQNADGSYGENWIYTATDPTQNTNETFTVNSDGSSSDTYTSSSGTQVTTIGTPQPAPSGTPGTVIAETTITTPATPGPSPSPSVQYLPNWWPNGKPPSPLMTDTKTDNGSVAIPAQCNIASSIATNAEDLQEKISTADPGFMFSEGVIGTETYDEYYAPGVGFVCGTASYTAAGYDETTGAPNGDYQITFVESLSATSQQSAARRTESMSAGSPVSMNMLESSLKQLVQHAKTKMRSIRAQHRRAATRASRGR